MNWTMMMYAENRAVVADAASGHINCILGLRIGHSGVTRASRWGVAVALHVAEVPVVASHSWLWLRS
jgi:hypothetical protein